jgi:TRAP-type C4-dicarboxylate transport system permease small subunit
MTDLPPRGVTGRGAGIDRLIWRAVDALLFVVMAALLFSVSCQAASRLLGFAAPWTEELARFLFIWTAFLGMATGFRRREHPRIIVLSAALPPSLRPFPHYLTAIATVSLFAIVGWHAVDLLMQRLAFGEISPVLGVGMWVATAPVVLGSALAAAGSLMALRLDLADERVRDVEPETSHVPLGKEHRP